MSATASLQPVGPPFAASWSEAGALRQPVGKNGRAHIDRWLPFLILHRGPDDPASIARRVAINSASYLVWDEGDDHAALSALEAVATRLRDEQGRLLVVGLVDRVETDTAPDSALLPPLAATIAAEDVAGSRRAANKLAETLCKLEIDLRQCDARIVPLEPVLPPAFHRLLNELTGVERLSLTLPAVHRRPDGGTFPAIAHDVSASAGDALLRAVCAFLDDGSGRAPKHYRSLGRSAYLSAALKADRKLGAIASSFDFLLSISPINTNQAREAFLSNGCEKPPVFHYRPLTVDPDLAKRDLYAIDLGALEDPLLEQLLAEKRREIDAQLTMLATRNTPSFLPASMFLYGSVDKTLIEDALVVLRSTATDPPRGPVVRAREIADAAKRTIAEYQLSGPFDARVEVRDDVSGLLVSGGCLMIGSDTMMPARRLEALLSHEVGIHLLTYFNGAQQGLAIFRTGLAGYEGIQEGLGVFAEWATGGLTRTRLRLLAGRVIAVEAMLKGATFIEVWRVLHREHGFSASGAFGIAARVFRSGGLAKDAIYLQGFKAVIELVRSGSALDPFWLGKIAVGHIPAVEELLQRRLAEPPRFLPRFLDITASRDRIAALRNAKSLHTIFDGDQRP